MRSVRTAAVLSVALTLVSFLLQAAPIQAAPGRQETTVYGMGTGTYKDNRRSGYVTMEYLCRTQECATANAGHKLPAFLTFCSGTKRSAVCWKAYLRHSGPAHTGDTPLLANYQHYLDDDKK